MPLLRDFGHLRFRAPVTFFVGENGSGKSTLLEALAAASGAYAIGRAAIESDQTLRPARELASALTLQRGLRPKTKAFLSAEDVFGFTQRVAQDMADLKTVESELLADSEASATARRRAASQIGAQRGALARRYGSDPDAGSHGETFLALLNERLVPHGLYFLDEPETPLSPTRILALIALLSRATADGSQFLIATHSPILMALPTAEILEFSGDRIAPVAYDDVEHVRVTRDFLNRPEAFLRRLADDAE
ncbi:MAG: AAA family ATPase [Candidatus Eremiobacteraeota bacterium]|nr:AAA family ATPase [Candidatus Eremiobacteraeota bacterium]